ncbi:L-lactate dehydrogenase [Brachybacterium halotolerans subsp. kimchii]|uniref:L-lactate dehydrogenase n=1 Tax=Brachybacterium halotolerans TaxID=2795215 RepID=UPI001E2C6342|nr:L-lactate dehydrogenase [Brachybacterium halotolerans]UEJ84063.1 L-lactate dehydrogenase [Brachybacterium halotolerans subsp. kimchii]
MSASHAPHPRPSSAPDRVSTAAPPTGGRLAVVGAGAVGSSVAYAAMLRGSARSIALYDIRAEKVRAEVLDLAHGSPLAGGAEITGGDDVACVAGADVVVITAGAAQAPGQTRLDLAGTNVKILESLMPQLLAQAPDAVFILVTNPCDVLTVAADALAALPRGRVFASGTVLDTSRLRWRLAERLGIAPRSIHATIIGEHGDSEFPLWSSAHIGQVPLQDWTDGAGAADAAGAAEAAGAAGAADSPALSREELDRLGHEVAGAAYEVIQGKGATNLAIGVAAARIVEAVLRDERAVLPVSSPLTGYQGISGVAMSVPSIVGRAGVERTLEVPMDEDERARLLASADALREVQRSLGL